MPAWDPKGRFLYAGQWAGNAIAAFERDFAPVCTSRNLAVAHNKTLSVPLTCADANGDPVTLQITANPTAGTLGAIDAANRRVFYSPLLGYSGPDSFKFRGVAFGQASAVATIGLTVAAPPPTSGGGGGLDADGDGFFAGQDCNDNNAAIRPGAQEIRGNNIDENCDGRAEPYSRINSTLSFSYKAFARYTTLKKIQVKNVPSGSKVKANCKRGKSKCAGRAKKAFTKKKAPRVVSLNKRYKGVKLKVGTKITVKVTKSQNIGSVKIVKIRKRKEPKVTTRCLPPGTKKPQKC
jgi:hypothetical protein